MHAYRLLIVLFAMHAATGSSSSGASELAPASVEPPDKNTRIERGNAYIYGFGVERDHVQALMWFILADSDGHCRLVAPYLTETQRSHAAALAEICEASGFKDC